MSDFFIRKDFIFPLPPKNLHRRYADAFSAFKQGLCCTLIGLPLSARSGYLKFILEYNPKFLSEFINPDIYKFIILEDTSTPESLVHTSAAKLIDLKILDPNMQSQLENRLKIHDLHLTLASLESAIKSISGKKLVLVLYEAEKILDNNPTSISFLLRLWNIHRSQPDAKVHLCFIGSPRLLELANKPIWTSLRPALAECVVNFPLFSPSEMSYLRHRLEYLSGSVIPDPIHHLASQLSAGHTVLYRILTQLALEELRQLQSTHTHPAVDSILFTIWNGLSTLDRQNSNFSIPLLPPTTYHQELSPTGQSLPNLTAQQKLIFDYLLSHPQQVVTRHEISQA